MHAIILSACDSAPTKHSCDYDVQKSGNVNDALWPKFVLPDLVKVDTGCVWKWSYSCYS